MSGVVEMVSDGISQDHRELGLREFTRLERLLLFAVVSECERCIRSEGMDCLASGRSVSCPFVAVRHEYGMQDIDEWRGRIG